MISSILSNLLIGGSEVSNKLPGRLGNPAETLISDERTDPRIKASFEQAEAAMASMSSIVDAMTSLQLGENPTREELLNYCSAFEKIASAEHPAMWEAMPEYPDVITSEQIIKGQKETTFGCISTSREIRTARFLALFTHMGGVWSS